MSDACGCGHDEPTTDETEEHAPEHLWQVRELQFAAVSGVFLLGALIVGWVGAPRAVEIGLEAVALALGAWTFVPSTLRRLVKGQIGVGTLMTIAAVGAVILGEVRSERRQCWPSCSPSAKASRSTRWPAPAVVCGPCCRWCPTKRPCAAAALT